MAAAPEHQQQYDRSRRPINPHIETSALGRKYYDYSTRSIRIFRVLSSGIGHSVFWTYGSLTPWFRRFTNIRTKQTSSGRIKLDRECALVTGATSGIGWATACALAKRGAVVGLLGRRRRDSAARRHRRASASRGCRRQTRRHYRAVGHRGRERRDGL